MYGIDLFCVLLLLSTVKVLTYHLVSSMLINYSGAVEKNRIVAIIITMTIADCHQSLYCVHDRSERKKQETICQTHMYTYNP